MDRFFRAKNSGDDFPTEAGVSMMNIGQVTAAKIKKRVTLRLDQ